MAMTLFHIKNKRDRFIFQQFMLTVSLLLMISLILSLNLSA